MINWLIIFLNVKNLILSLIKILTQFLIICEPKINYLGPKQDGTGRLVIDLTYSHLLQLIWLPKSYFLTMKIHPYLVKNSTKLIINHLPTKQTNCNTSSSLLHPYYLLSLHLHCCGCLLLAPVSHLQHHHGTTIQPPISPPTPSNPRQPPTPNSHKPLFFNLIKGKTPTPSCIFLSFVIVFCMIIVYMIKINASM